MSERTIDSQRKLRLEVGAQMCGAVEVGVGAKVPCGSSVSREWGYRAKLGGNGAKSRLESEVSG